MVVCELSTLFEISNTFVKKQLNYYKYDSNTIIFAQYLN